MPLLWTTEYYTPELLRKYSQYTFVFGDNLQRIGKGGQAIIRDEPNVIGVSTKVSPNYCFSELDGGYVERGGLLESEEVIQLNWRSWLDIIDSDLRRVEDKLALGETVVVPMDFIGTGLARLTETAPGLLFYLYHRFNLMMHKYGQWYGELKND